MAGLTATLGSRASSFGRIVLGQAPTYVTSTPAWLPQIVVEFSPSTGPMGAAVWVDITDSMVGFTCSRGRQTETDRTEAGILNLILANDDRQFDPLNTVGPFYGSLVPRKRIRIRAIWNGVDYPVFAGYVETWNPPLWRYGAVQCQVKLTDGLALLAQKKISGDFPQQTTDARIKAILAAAGWSTGQGWVLGDAVWGILGSTTFAGPVGDQSISAGQTTVQAVTLTNVSALAHIQLMAATENGIVACGADGSLVFRGRHELLYQQSVKATFGPNQNFAEVPYADAAIDATGQRIWNDVSITRVGGVVQQVTDATSIAAYFGRTYSLSGLPLLTDTEAASYANFILLRYKDFHVRLTELTMEPAADPARCWPVALSLALGDRVQVKSAPDIGSSLSEPVLVERISHTFDATRATWVTEFALSPLAESGAGTQAPWVLGVTGTLGTDTIPVY